jgi:hypothetical protein
MGINYSANRPDPDGPGGLGAEESGAERTGPTQYAFLAIQNGGRWAEVGRHYDSANDPVTVCFWLPRGAADNSSRADSAVTAPLRRAAVGAIMSPDGKIPKSGIRFSEQDHASG